MALDRSSGWYVDSTANDTRRLADVMTCWAMPYVLRLSKRTQHGASAYHSVAERDEGDGHDVGDGGVDCA